MKATFIKSAAKADQFPPPELPEIAFVGRSNVGKSSLINALTGHTGLAKTSRTPGRTRLVNWFRIEANARQALAFVDLPGYGYAKVSRSERDAWRPMVESYLRGRSVLRVVVILIDARRSITADEIDLIAWLHELNLSVIAVLTKADKLPKSKRKLAELAAKRELGLKRPPFVTSTLSRDGVTELWRELLARAAPK